MHNDHPVWDRAVVQLVTVTVRQDSFSAPTAGFEAPIIFPAILPENPAFGGLINKAPKPNLGRRMGLTRVGVSVFSGTSVVHTAVTARAVWLFTAFY